MNENKKQKKTILKKAIKRVLLIQFVAFISLVLIDLYIFKGFYTSKVIIHPEFWNEGENYSCEFNIRKKTDNKYLFTFKNSISPKYFVNYRNEKHFQNVSDTLFFDYLGKNLFPAYSSNFSYSFGCGTGLGYTSINPFESHKVEKSYTEIIKECSSINLLKNSSYLSNKKYSKEYFFELNNTEIDSLIKYENQFVSVKDSIQVEYFIVMYSFISKNKMHIVSNRINVSVKDLLNEYCKQN